METFEHAGAVVECWRSKVVMRSWSLGLVASLGDQPAPESGVTVGTGVAGLMFTSLVMPC